MDPFYLKEKETFFIAEWQKNIPGLIAGFTTKNGGISNNEYTSLNLGLHVDDLMENVRRNREILADLIDIPVDNWVAAEQIHDTKVAVIQAEDRGKGARSTESSIKGTDGIISNEKSLLLTAFYADCVPLFFLDRVTEWFGIAHAGWKGTVGKIAEKMVQELEEQGCKADDIQVAIGPSISEEYYEVDDKVISRIPGKWQKSVVFPLKENKYRLDLKKLNKEILLGAGINKNNIRSTSFCTYRDEDLFFSHRRERGKTGRMLGFIGFTDK